MQPVDDNVLTRGLRVLETLAGMEQPASLDRITEQAKLTRTKTYRCLVALEAQGYITHVGRSGYRTTGRALGLALLLGPRPVVRQRALPHLVRLNRDTRTKATLFLRSGAHRVLMLVVGAGQEQWRDVVIGSRAPLFSGCTGRSILAWLPEEEQRAILDASTDSHEIRPEDLADVRDQGYATSRSANHQGVSGVAAPILDPDDGLPLGCICLADEADRLPDSSLHEMSQSLRATCLALGPQLAPVVGRTGALLQTALDVRTGSGSGSLTELG
ncbi:IclR family transcriptional regulator [Pseudonocardia alni]|uniref:IclR family transcriptional regulator n=1 Tax=Pseudonocardia alni TaxID=33907 RepID=UPI00280AC80B|nr:IclR family transcriptional regulator C-terminal domain-containing protein [Pseudonocardia alni]